VTQTAVVTGGAGYIGSHTCVALLEAGWRVAVVDDLSNSSPAAVDRVRALVPGGSIELHEASVLDADALDRILAAERPAAVVHFAGLKAVGESVAEPARYWKVNVAGTVNLVEAMSAHGVGTLVFSSSATVYGDPASVPLTEDSPLAPVNPYGETKLAVERLLAAVAASSSANAPAWRIALLRYFNPVGAHPSGTIGEDPHGIPNNLMPVVMQVAVGRLAEVSIFGDDYPTPDGTGVRDYVHVMDLAAGHVAALSWLGSAAADATPCRAFNLGTGQGHSVHEVLAAASRAVGRQLPSCVVERRPGDIAAMWADPSRAEAVLGWKATRSLDEMCADHWRWQRANPNGYRSG
jgi:UDP-glucose 4-epimerase